MVSLDIPTYFNDEFVEFVKTINRNSNVKISHVYGSISGFFSARESNRLPEVLDLDAHIKELKKINVDFFYAFNTSCLGSLSSNEIERIKTEIGRIYDLGVENFIIAHPFLIQLIKKDIPNSKIKASVILEIDNKKTLEYYVDKVDIINISTKVNRDFRFLESIKDYKDKIELLCNEVCLYNCPFRTAHYTIESHRHEKYFDYSDFPVNLCYEMMTEKELLMSRFILPEWIDMYSEFAEFFKISGRTFPVKFIYNAAYHYSNKTSPNNIMELFPIVTGSIRNEQSNVFDHRKLVMSDLEKSKFIIFFKYNGQNCKYNCPCGHCSLFERHFVGENDK